eukprot:CFRG8276T1
MMSLFKIVILLSGIFTSTAYVQDGRNFASFGIKGIATKTVVCNGQVTMVSGTFDKDGFSSNGENCFTLFCAYPHNTVSSSEANNMENSTVTADSIGNATRTEIIDNTNTHKDMPLSDMCTQETQLNSHCNTNGSSLCPDGHATCAPGMCENGFENRASASECVKLDGCTLHAKRVAMSSDGQWIIQSIPTEDVKMTPSEIVNGNREDPVLYLKLVARLYSLVQSTASWVAQADVLIPDINLDIGTETDKAYGASVAICGTSGDNTDANLMVLVGDSSAVLEDIPAVGLARLYVYNSTKKSLLLKAILHPPQTTSNLYFGSGVALSGDCSTAVVGAYGMGDRRGEAYVYNLDHACEGTLECSKVESAPVILTSETLRPTDHDGVLLHNQNQFYGQAVAASYDGKRVFVGGHRAGAVYVYRQFDRYLLTQKISVDISEDDAVDEQNTVLNKSATDTGDSTDLVGYGSSLACNCKGDVLVVGSPLAGNGAGKVYVYQLLSNEFILSGTSGKLSPTIQPPISTLYGMDVAINCDGTLVMVGAPGGGLNSKGYVDLYERNYVGDGVPTTDRILPTTTSLSIDEWRLLYTQGPDIGASSAVDDIGYGASVSISGDGAVAVVGSVFHALHVSEFSIQNTAL